MSIYLEVKCDENLDFFEIYDMLSPLRKRIWNKIAEKCRSWTNVIPSQSTIAKWCDCSRSAVSEAFRIFKNHGWIYLQSRGWKKSKKICMPHSKQHIDVVNRKWFKTVRATHRATHTYNTYTKDTSSRTGEIAIPQYLGKLDISTDSKIKLSLVPEHIYQETLYQCQKKSKLGFKPECAEKYFVGTAIKMAEKMGLKIDWRSYYYTKSKNFL